MIIVDLFLVKGGFCKPPGLAKSKGSSLFRLKGLSWVNRNARFGQGLDKLWFKIKFQKRIFKAGN